MSVKELRSFLYNEQRKVKERRSTASAKDLAREMTEMGHDLNSLGLVKKKKEKVVVETPAEYYDSPVETPEPIEETVVADPPKKKTVAKKRPVPKPKPA